MKLPACVALRTPSSESSLNGTDCIVEPSSLLLKTNLKIAKIPAMRKTLIPRITILYFFGFIDGHGRNAGLDVDIARQLSQELFGNVYCVEFRPVTSGNQIRALRAGEVDVVIAAASVSAQRKNVVDFSDPYFVSGHLIIEREDDTIGCRDDLHGKTIATLKGSTDDTTVCDPAFGAVCVTFRTVPEAVHAVQERRADAFVDDDVVLIEIAKENRDLRIAGWKPFAVNHYGAEVRKGDKEWLGFVNATLEKMRETSKYTNLLRKRFGMLRVFLYERMLPSRNGV